MKITLIKAAVLVSLILETALLIATVVNGECDRCRILLSGNVMALSFLNLA